MTDVYVKSGALPTLPFHVVQTSDGTVLNKRAVCGKTPPLMNFGRRRWYEILDHVPDGDRECLKCKAL